jgi:hypothetical protein
VRAGLSGRQATTSAKKIAAARKRRCGVMHTNL